ncbi:perforin-1-like [Labrus mixtus]|uniref:perforin-1-like n=1 Tax=Labrus mixtus TaxID=508554 RepID=UPI0029BFBDF0|nr:perforin-1-like [Labrus mixtus]
MTLKMKLAVFASLLVLLPFKAEAGSCVGKTVKVWVIKGRHLTGDGFSHPDPYVKVTIGEETRQTRIIYSDSNPVWYQKFRFYDTTSDIMRIDIRRADGGGYNHHLGTCIERLESGGGYWQKVKCRATDSGYVKLYYRCY